MKKTFKKSSKRATIRLGKITLSYRRPRYTL